MFAHAVLIYSLVVHSSIFNYTDVKQHTVTFKGVSHSSALHKCNEYRKGVIKGLKEDKHAHHVKVGACK